MSGKIKFFYIWISLVVLMVTAVTTHSHNTAATATNKFPASKIQPIAPAHSSQRLIPSMVEVAPAQAMTLAEPFPLEEWPTIKAERLTPLASRFSGSPVVKTATAQPYPIERYETTPFQPKSRLPNRTMPGICTVTTTAEIGPGSLHQCILDAVPGGTINFDPTVFPLANPNTIAFFFEPLPWITTNNLTIDGSNAGVILDGFLLSLFNPSPGLVIDGASNVTIKGLEIYFFAPHGITLINGANNNIIGGGIPAERNVISGNLEAGVAILHSGSNNNQVIGNYIGTNATGSTPLGNDWGVVVTSGAQNNIIGGNTAGMRNIISGNQWGVQFQNPGTTNNQITGNYIGTNAGTATLANYEAGVVLSYGARNNIIGGTTAGKRNIISGNGTGIQIQDSGTTGNQVQGNYIGTNATGTAALGNEVWGVTIGFGAQNNVIGGSTTEARNVISGNYEVGIQLQNAGTNNNKIQGNYIGTDREGLNALSNSVGIYIIGSPQNNLIGGQLAGEGNLISGNTDLNNSGAGILITDSDTDNNEVIGNYIGTDASGTMPLANGFGVVIAAGAQYNTIGGNLPAARNIISGNSVKGIEFQGTDTAHNIVSGNYVGTDVTGKLPLGNGEGVSILAGAHHNIIGGDTAVSRNVISGNSYIGVALGLNGTSYNQIIGNYIGVDNSGLAALGNACIGVLIDDFAQNNNVGGTDAGMRNVISGNGLAEEECIIAPETGGSGVQIENGASHNQLLGNYIGTDVSGTMPLGNIVGVAVLTGAQNNIIGGEITEARNLISGNAGVGIIIQDSGTQSNQVSGNYIGTDVTGTTPLSNTHGILLSFGAHDNIVGGEVEGLRNIISGNTIVGVQFQNEDTNGNRVLGNYVGMDATGTLSSSNSVGISVGFGAHHNTIGGCTENVGNLISGNNEGVYKFGIGFQNANTHGNEVAGNFIGTDTTGTVAIPNGYGIFIQSGAHNNIIGGSNPGCRNVISGNKQAGIWLQDNQTDDNQVVGNYIGTDVSGKWPLSNAIGVAIVNRAEDNIIGGSSTGAGNIISGNGLGIRISDIDTKGNTMEGNSVGIDKMGSPLANESVGISLENGTSANTIGISNTIAHNGSSGIIISGTSTLQNTITRNLIHHNGGLPIRFIPEGPNPLPPASFCYDASQMEIRGSTCPSCQVEIFASSTTFLAGEQFLGEGTANNNGSLTINLLSPPANDLPYLSATVTNVEGTTFEFYDVSTCTQKVTYLPMVTK